MSYLKQLKTPRAPSGNAIVAVVITSELTWQNLAAYCFNEHFQVQRHRFDLCVIVNGDSLEPIYFLEQYQPDYLLQRPNLGMDPAALNDALAHLPYYNYYLILHDDHWFGTSRWLDDLSALVSSDPATDVWGNLVTSCSYNSEAFDNFFSMVSSVVTDDLCYYNMMFPHYLQGMAGLFKGSALEQFRHLGGVPHVHHNTKKMIEILERLFSYVLLNRGITFRQIPPGYELYLRHRDHNWELAESVAGKRTKCLPEESSRIHR